MTLVGLPILPAGVLSFCAAAVVNYALTARFVFHQETSLRGFARFFLGAFSGLAINLGTTLMAATALGGHAVVAKIIGIGVAFLFNFTVNLCLIFRTDITPAPGGAARTGTGRFLPRGGRSVPR